MIERGKMSPDVVGSSGISWNVLGRPGWHKAIVQDMLTYGFDFRGIVSALIVIVEIVR